MGLNPTAGVYKKRRNSENRRAEKKPHAEIGARLRHMTCGFVLFPGSSCWSGAYVKGWVVHKPKLGIC